MDNTLKHRLIGASVLVALAVIFLPALVKGPTVEGDASDVAMTAPPAANDGAFQTRELPLVVPAGASSAVPETVNPDAAELAAAQEMGRSTPAVAAGDYAVNFGAYDSERNAGIVIEALAKQGLSAYAEATTISNKPAWRVRIGPFADRPAAESARLSAASVSPSLEAKVVVLDHAKPTPAPAAQVVSTALQVNQEAALPSRTVSTAPRETAPAVATAVAPKTAPVESPKPTQPPVAETKPAAKPAPAPAAAAVGWAVQLGAFSKSEDANALRDRLRGAGFSTFVEQVPTDKGMLTRVRVGPVTNRDDAVALRDQVAAKTGVAGVPVRHP